MEILDGLCLVKKKGTWLGLEGALYWGGLQGMIDQKRSAGGRVQNNGVMFLNTASAEE